MSQTMLQKIIAAHLLAGDMRPGAEIGIKIDQTLTQDSLGAMAYLEFEAMGSPRVLTELSVSYVDHLTLQLGEGNADVHRYLETLADCYGIVYSKPGNGICHQLHLERFSMPGKTLIGGDSHTVTCGAVGMAAFGAGGLDVALAMAGKPFFFTYPRIIRVNLIGRLRPWVTAKDIALNVLKTLTCQNNVGTALEYAGEGLAGLSVPERATIANLGAESGVTTSIFPSDEATKDFLQAQNRLEAWRPLCADADAVYDGELTLDLSALEPSIAQPHSPDQVVNVRQLAGLKVDQVLIGSCTNASYQDIYRAAEILRGCKIPGDISVAVVPGSRQVLSMLEQNGALGWLIGAGVRILESSCGFCVGQGQAPQLAGVSLRTNNRNYKGRSGTQDARVFLASPETAAATARTGYLCDPRDLPLPFYKIPLPQQFTIDDSMFLQPGGAKEIYRSRLIGQPPLNTPMPQRLLSKTAIKVGDNINTDDIIPGGEAMTYRANIQKSCEYVYRFIDDKFPARCREIQEAGYAPLIIGGWGYGQGSSREHAALCPMSLGVRCLIAKSIERIHYINLINFGILPLTFNDPHDYEKISLHDQIEIEDISIAVFNVQLSAVNLTTGEKYLLNNGATPRQAKIILAGGILNTL